MSIRRCRNRCVEIKMNCNAVNKPDLISQSIYRHALKPISTLRRPKESRQDLNFVYCYLHCWICCCVKCNWKQQFTVNFFKWKLLHRYCLKFFTIQCINSVFYYTNTVFNFFSSVDSKFKCNLFKLFDNFVSAGTR